MVTAPLIIKLFNGNGAITKRANPFFVSLHSELTHELQTIEATEQPLLPKVEQCISVVKAAMERLRQYLMEHPFSAEKDEIQFFKEVKPKFYSRLIYYIKVFRAESRRPLGSKKLQKKFLQNELSVLDRSFWLNGEFYQYYRSGATHLDETYFVRGRQNIRLITEPHSLSFDPSFHTSHDYTVAELLANELFCEYLTREMTLLRKKEGRPEPSSTALPKGTAMNWTAPKAALIELLYALYSYGAYNNGRADIKDIARHFEQTYNIDLGNFYRVFQEIRIRKNSTSFLDQLKEKVKKRMDDSDENPRYE